MGDDRLKLTPDELLAEHGHPNYGDVKQRTHKERCGEIANLYWHFRKVSCSEHTTDGEKAAARRMERICWDAMGRVPADPLPAWVPAELAEWADRMAMLDRSVRDDLPGRPVHCRGHWPFGEGGYGITKRLPGDGWTDYEPADNGFRAVWFNDRTKNAVVTYCEGDFTVDIFQTPEQYEAYTAYTRRFYEEIIR